MSIILKDAVVERMIYNDDECIGKVFLCPVAKYISDFIIYDQYRNKGYGQAVLKMLINEGYNILMINSYNDAGIHICEKYSFVKEGKTTIGMRLVNPRKDDSIDLK